ncbi:MAG: Hsp33 family molecular chaperone HslO [Spirochaetia bacterium]
MNNSANKSKLSTFILEDGNIRGAFIDSTKIVQEMQKAHNTGVLESIALGQAYTAAGLLTVTQKGEDRLRLQVNCEGPLQGFLVESSAKGNVRGYLKTEAIEIEEAPESFDLAPFYGQGIIRMTRYPEGAKQPYTSDSILYHSDLAKDLTRFFLNSEQIPTSFTLSVHLDTEGRVDGAGGLFLQALPAAQELNLDSITADVYSLPSIGTAIAENQDMINILKEVFSNHALEFIDEKEIRFSCPCSKERFARALISLPYSDREDLLKNGPFPLPTQCHFCNAEYHFTEEELKELFTE